MTHSGGCRERYGSAASGRLVYVSHGWEAVWLHRATHGSDRSKEVILMKHVVSEISGTVFSLPWLIAKDYGLFLETDLSPCSFMPVRITLPCG